jgi:hypothetical protein
MANAEKPDGAMQGQDEAAVEQPPADVKGSAGEGKEKKWIDEAADAILRNLEEERRDPEAALERERKHLESFKPSSAIPGPAVGLPPHLKKKPK